MKLNDTWEGGQSSVLCMKKVPVQTGISRWGWERTQRDDDSLCRQYWARWSDSVKSSYLYLLSAQFSSLCQVKLLLSERYLSLCFPCQIFAIEKIQNSTAAVAKLPCRMVYQIFLRWNFSRFWWQKHNFSPWVTVIKQPTQCASGFFFFFRWIDLALFTLPWKWLMKQIQRLFCGGFFFVFHLHYWYLIDICSFGIS